MTRRHVSGVVLSLLWGCSGESASPPSVLASDAPGQRSFWAESRELRERLRDGTGRLAAATGRADIGLDPAGVQVSMVLDLGSCSRALPGTLELHANPPEGQCREVTEDFMHATMHLLAPSAGHSTSGVFAPEPDAPSLDAASLEAFCASFECLAFSPERP